MSHLSAPQQWFLDLGKLHPLGLMPYYPDQHPIAAELEAMGLIEYSHIEHQKMLSEAEAMQMKVRQQMYKCTSFGYFITDKGRDALKALDAEKPPQRETETA